MPLTSLGHPLEQEVPLDAVAARSCKTEAGVPFPVGLSSLRLLAMHVLSQARRLGGLHRASPVPFRGSYFTSGLHSPALRPKGSSPACTGDGDFLSLHHCASWRTLVLEPAVVRVRRWPPQPWRRRDPQSGAAVGPTQTPVSPSAGAPGTTGCETASGAPDAPGTRWPPVSSGAC